MEAYFCFAPDHHRLVTCQKRRKNIAQVLDQTLLRGSCGAAGYNGLTSGALPYRDRFWHRHSLVEIIHAKEPFLNIAMTVYYIWL